MNHVNVTINGRQYRMACEEGQEERLLQLAESFESRIGSLRGKFGEIGDARALDALTLALKDEDASIRRSAAMAIADIGGDGGSHPHPHPHPHPRPNPNPQLSFQMHESTRVHTAVHVNTVVR